jgi:hypothetical protein
MGSNCSFIAGDSDDDSEAIQNSSENAALLQGNNHRNSSLDVCDPEPCIQRKHLFGVASSFVVTYKVMQGRRKRSQMDFDLV